MDCISFSSSPMSWVCSSTYYGRVQRVWCSSEVNKIKRASKHVHYPALPDFLLGQDKTLFEDFPPPPLWPRRELLCASWWRSVLPDLVTVGYPAERTALFIFFFVCVKRMPNLLFITLLLTNSLDKLHLHQFDIWQRWWRRSDSEVHLGRLIFFWGGGGGSDPRDWVGQIPFLPAIRKEKNIFPWLEEKKILRKNSVGPIVDPRIA